MLLIFSWKSASPVKRKKNRPIQVCTSNASQEEPTSSAVVDEDRITAPEEEITRVKLRNEELQENLCVEREKSLALKATVTYQNNARITKRNLSCSTALTQTKT